MRFASTWGAGLLALAGMSCVEKGVEAAPEVGKVMLLVVPVDGTTGYPNRAEAKAIVRVPQSLSGSGQPVVDAIAASIRVADPSGNIVPTWQDQRSLGLVSVTENFEIAVGPLNTYAVGLNELKFDLPANVVSELDVDPDVHFYSAGTLGARFSVDSNPKLTGVDFCDWGGSSTTILGFTEPVRLVQGQLLSAAVQLTNVSQGESVQCSGAAVGGGEVFDASVPHAAWELDCGQLNGVVQLLLQGVESATQPPVSLSGSAVGEAATIVIDELPPAQDGCRRWTAPR